MYRTLNLLLLYCGSVLVLCGSNINYSYTQLSIKQGLSQSTINSLLLDHTGNLWIATQNGLNNYSQQGLKTYLHNQDDPNSLPDNYIYHIAEDAERKIWISTKKGLTLYNKDINQFTTISPNLIYSSLCIDDGILFGGDNLICHYDYKKKNYTHIFIKKKSQATEKSVYRVQRMVRLDKNTVLIGTKEKVFICMIFENRNSHAFHRITTSSFHSILLPIKKYMPHFMGMDYMCLIEKGKYSIIILRPIHS